MAMAFSSKLQFLLLMFLFLIPASLSNDPNHPFTTLRSPTQDVQDLLRDYDLPIGLFPANVESYSFNSEDNTFIIKLNHDCIFPYLDDIYYAKTFTGKLDYKKVSDITGILMDIRGKRLPVIGITVDYSKKEITFEGQLYYDVFPVSVFQEIITYCENEGFQQSLLASI